MRIVVIRYSVLKEAEQDKDLRNYFINLFND